jgi:DMSO/TMAO reductase YedYZ molybdopterin-dependent catalytic subunit
MKRNMLRTAATIVLLAALAGAAGCTPTGTDDLTNLAAAEVKEYEGEALSSILDFQENSIKGPQVVDISTYTLTVDGLVANPASYTYDQALENRHYVKVVTLHCVEGWIVRILWEGILLKDLFDKAGVDASANTVIFHGYDGYTTSLPLETVLDRDMIIAYKMNGVVLPGARGFPFQLVAEEQYGYKWCKWITRIELSGDADYLGYWERRGYPNDAAYP